MLHNLAEGKTSDGKVISHSASQVLQRSSKSRQRWLQTVLLKLNGAALRALRRVINTMGQMHKVVVQLECQEIPANIHTSAGISR